MKGIAQDPLDGTSFAYTFADAAAPDRKHEQYFENNGSRALYRDGWIACAFGPFTPWQAAASTAGWDPKTEPWQLYDLKHDYSQSHDLAAQDPHRLAALQERFLEVAKDNKVFPVGAGNWLRLHPEDRITSPYRDWHFGPATARMPEFAAPGLGRQNTLVTIDAEVPVEASGVLYALGGASGGLALHGRGRLVYAYNMMVIEQYEARSVAVVPAGRHRITVTTHFATPQPISPAEVVLAVDGVEVGRTTVARTVPGAFSASETLDVGRDLGSPVARAYDERRPFAFEGRIHDVHVELQ